jgi:hypothetical protein
VLSPPLRSSPTNRTVCAPAATVKLLVLKVLVFVHGPVATSV